MRGAQSNRDRIVSERAPAAASLYVGFAAPYLLALGSHVASYAALLALSALLALVTAALVARPRRGTVGERVPAAL
jgi:hypothetical protein